ncbi:MerR family transcriptional regulator [Dactylosporangium cerinum]
MRIGELAEQAGTSARALRYYEQQGLLSARRSSNGYRDYDEEDLRLVREIRALLEIGFNLEDTRPFVECIREGTAPAPSVRRRSRCSPAGSPRSTTTSCGCGGSGPRS